MLYDRNKNENKLHGNFLFSITAVVTVCTVIISFTLFLFTIWHYKIRKFVVMYDMPIPYHVL